MKKYKVNFSGFAYIMADDITEAEEKFSDDDVCYKETNTNEIEEVDEFVIEI